MDDIELRCIMQKDPIVYKHYSKQIYCIDTLPDQLIPDKFYLINLLSSDELVDNVGHWCVILGRRTQEHKNTRNTESQFTDYVYCDPLGDPPPKQLYDKIHKQCKYYLNFPLQNILSSTCGMHSLILSTFYSYGFTIKTTLLVVYDVNDHSTKKNDFFFYMKAKRVLEIMFHEK